MKCIFTDCFISGGDSHQRSHRGDLLILPKNKRKRLLKKGSRNTLEANPRRIYHSSTTR